eukprot:scaffold18175_cov63-Phaeocystis_antarctica.AAC.1
MSTTGVVDGATAPTHSSAQNAASHLIRRGRITCGADHMREPAGSGRASRDAACSGRASRPPRTTRTATQQRVHLTRFRGVHNRPGAQASMALEMIV